MSRFLQRLEIHGFKSFNHKTTIEFLDGVTIVVGPNGCGKSNVLDALRWVLGETSAKSLRGGRMGDVLFRGSAGYKPSGMAQVTLTCSNESSVLKIDQREVQVQRRLFSNGDSEYNLNKQHCRMRDVHELLLDTGLGSDGYAIIEQGRIGEMITAKPEQRREIFEEAAGIARYKARREETVRKLVRTEEDLLRLFDHISEVEKSANSLYRQARKAERFRRLTRRLRRLQKRSLWLRHEAFTRQRTDVESAHAAAREAFEAASSRLAAAEAGQAELARRLEDFQQETQRLQQARYERQTALERERHRAEMLEQRRASIGERAAVLTREIESGDARAQILAQTIAALEADLLATNRGIQSQELVLAEEGAGLDAVRRAQEQRNHSLAQLRSALGTAQAKVNALENEKRLAAALIEKLAADAAAQDTHTKALAQEAAAAEQEAAAHQGAVERLRAELMSIGMERQRIRQELGEQSRSRDQLAQKVDELGRELQHATSRLLALQELEDNFEGYFRGVKEVMVAAQNRRLFGIVGVVSNLIEVPGNLDVAIEVALGGDLQDIVTKGVDDAKAAIQFLKEHNFGRATFLPLDFLHADIGGHGIDQVLGRRGVVGLARDLVRYDRQLEPAVKYLFGNTIVVEHLDIAVELERAGMRQRYVSLHGDIVNPRGVLSGGSHKTRGLLSRAREIHELKSRKDELQRRLEDLRAEHEHARNAAGSLQARDAALQARVHELQMAEARAAKDVEAAEARRRDRRNALAVAQARITQQQHDTRRHHESIERAESALAGLLDEIGALEAQVRDAEGLGTEERARHDALAERVSTLRGELSLQRERARNLATKVADLIRDRDSVGSERGTREAERAQAIAAAERCVAEREEAEQQVARLTRERDELEARASALQQENEEMVREAGRARAGLAGLLRERNECENAFREREVALAEVRVQLEYLEREAAEDFAMPIADIGAELASKPEEEASSIVSPGGAADDEAEPEAPSREERADDEVTDVVELRRIVSELKDRIGRIGPVNEQAIEDYAATKQRLDFLHGQRDDLIAAKDQLRATIAQIDETTTKLFTEAFETIRGHFVDIFRRLFNGGKADLIMVPSETNPEPGIDIFAQPPGKNIGGSLSLMSGGEKALTACALMFAMFKFKPSPICVLDEVDAPLDDANCHRLCNLIRDFAKETQFMVVTHNKITMSLADSIYGVTMQEPGVSKVVSVRFDKIDESGLLDANPAAG